MIPGSESEGTETHLANYAALLVIGSMTALPCNNPNHSTQTFRQV